MKSWHLVLLSILITFLIAGLILLVAKPTRGAPIVLLPASTQTQTNPPQPSATPAPIKVQIGGQVKTTGLYELGEEARLEDLILVAGGLTELADQNRVNLVLRLLDGGYYYIPAMDENIPDTAANAPLNAQMSEETIKYPINLNTATQEELESLPGIGPTKAADILSYRKEIGAFSSIDELLNVTGIGPSTLEAIIDLITIEP
jgi:competence protein ComEA